jgi:hypothetical protein
MSRTIERMQLAGTRLREQRAEMRATRVDRQNQRLRADLEALRSELRRERDEREDLLDAIKEGPMRTSKGGALKLVIVGGVAYVLGAKAGRARYEQISSWVRRTKERGMQRVEQARREGAEDTLTSMAGDAPASLGVTTRSVPSTTSSTGAASGMPVTSGIRGTGSAGSTTDG